MADSSIACGPASQPNAGFETRVIGPAYFMLAIVAGLAGAGIGGQGTELGSSAIARHGVMMTFFVIIPSLLGGLGNGLLPSRLRTDGMALRGLNVAGLLLFALGLLAILGAGFAGAQASALVAAGLGVGCVAMISLAIVLIASILDGRRSGVAMDTLTWSQLFGASALIAVVPLIGAALTRAAFGTSGPLASVLSAMPLPAATIALAPACGIVADVLEVDLTGKRLRICLVSALGIMSIGAAVVWDRLMVVHMDWPASLTVALQAIPAVVAVGAALVGSWRHLKPASLPLAWICGVVVLLSAGWLVGNADARHSAMAFGLIFAAFAGLYRWLGLSGRDVGPMAWPHCVLTAVGTVATLMPTILPEPIGGAAMSAALVCLVPMVLRAFTGPAPELAHVGAAS